jgi:hypothetical protein
MDFNKKSPSRDSTPAGFLLFRKKKGIYYKQPNHLFPPPSLVRSFKPKGEIKKKIVLHSTRQPTQQESIEIWESPFRRFKPTAAYTDIVFIRERERDPSLGNV